MTVFAFGLLHAMYGKELVDFACLTITTLGIIDGIRYFPVMWLLGFVDCCLFSRLFEFSRK